MTLIQAIASAIEARDNCRRSGNTEWYDRWTDRLDAYARQLPSGSGIDCGTRIDLDKSTGARVVLTADYHHMDGESGMYDGWTSHAIIVTPTFQSINVDVRGRNRNDIKEYLCDVYHAALTEPAEKEMSA